MSFPLDDLLLPGADAERLYHAVIAASRDLELPVDVDRRLSELIAAKLAPKEVVDALSSYVRAREAVADRDGANQSGVQEG